MAIQIKTKDGYRDIPGTGVSRPSMENFPEHWKALDGGVTGTYQETGTFSLDYEWFADRANRLREFQLSQLRAYDASFA